MFAIIYKEDRIPMCARVKEAGPDAVVTWDSETAAKRFLEGKGDDFITAYDIVAINDNSLPDIAKAMGLSEEDVELIPFPA